MWNRFADANCIFHDHGRTRSCGLETLAGAEIDIPGLAPDKLAAVQNEVRRAERRV